MRPHEKTAYIAFMKRRFSQSSHVNCSICRKCGGTCCKRGGCGLMTCDIPEMSVIGIRRMLDTGKYSIMFFCADLGDGIIKPIPIMNAREVDSGRVNNSIIRKQCALQGENGCMLSDTERPTMGLLYIPKGNGECKMLIDAMEVFKDWYPHAQMMEEVVRQETGKSSQELFYSGCVQAAMEIRQKMDLGADLTSTEIDALQVLDITGIIAILGE